MRGHTRSTYFLPACFDPASGCGRPARATTTRGRDLFRWSMAHARCGTGALALPVGCTESDLMRDDRTRIAPVSTPTWTSTSRCAYPTTIMPGVIQLPSNRAESSGSSETAIWAADCGRMNPISTA